MREKIVIRQEKINKEDFTYISSSSVMSFKFVDKDGKIKYFKKEGVFCNANNEIIADSVFEELGMPHVSHERAVFIDNWNNKHYGLVSEDYKKINSDVEILSYKDVVEYYEDVVSLERIKTDVISFFKTKFGAEKVNFSKDFDLNYKKLATILYLFSQKDPYPNNYEFMVKMKDDEWFVTFSPFFDSSISFYKSITKLNPPKNMSKRERQNHLVLYRPMMLIDEKGSRDPYRETLYKQIYKHIKSDKEFFKFYNKIIGLNLQDTVQKYSSNSKTKKVDENDLKIAIECFEQSKILLLEGIEKAKESENKNINQPNSIVYSERYL